MKQVEQIFNEVSNIINNDNIKKDLLSDKQYKRALTNLKKYNKSSGIKIKNIRDKLDANASNIKEYLLEAKKGRYNLNKFYKEMMETIHYDLG
jgi:predicted metallo-beta-lactamase superfamily hydrolase